MCNASFVDDDALDDDFESDSYDQEGIVLPKEAANKEDEWSEEVFEDFKKLATKYLETFFADKELYCGGPLPKSMVMQEDYIFMLMEIDIIEAVKKAYIALEDNRFFDEEQISEYSDVKLIVEIMDECARLKIPKIFAGGLILVYLKLCEGVEI